MKRFDICNMKEKTRLIKRVGETLLFGRYLGFLQGKPLASTLNVSGHFVIQYIYDRFMNHNFD